MVNRKEGQSTFEFLFVLGALTLIGLIISFIIRPWNGGAISNAQDIATVKISQD